MGGTDTGWRLAGLALAWLAGVALHLQAAVLAPVSIHAAAIATGALGLVLAWYWRRAWIAALLGALLLGWGVSGWHAALRLADGLASSLEGQDLVVTGVVASLPRLGASGVRFRFRVDDARLQGQAVSVPADIALGWYAGAHEDALPNPPRAELRAGQRWSFTVRLRQPHGHVNPHGFDYELYLFEQGVRATGYVRDAPARRLDEGAAFAVERLRQRVRDAIGEQVPERRSAGVLAALAVGDQGAIEREDWDLFRNTGIAHLVSISGLHVTMFAWWAGLIIGASWRRSATAMLWLPAPQAARWGGFAAAAAYAVFSGWGVPAQRTVWMLAVVTLLQGLGLRWPWSLVLLVAAWVVTLFDPWALLQAGFWLSFTAVGLLMASAPVQAATAPLASARGPSGWGRRLLAAARAGVSTQWRVTLGLTPLTLVFFQQVSLVGLVANLVSIPLVTLVITPLALLGVAAAPLWTTGAWVVQQLSVLLAWLASVPGAVWRVPAAPAWAQWAALIPAVVLVLPLPWRARLLVLPLLLPLGWPARTVPEPGRFELMAVDVGQGTAIVIRTRAHLLVYDAGPQYSRDSDAGQRVLLPLLRAEGATRIDRLVLSHRDTDHVGGARALLAGLPVDDVLSSLEGSHPLLATLPRQSRCESGASWNWDGVRFDILRPPAGDYARSLKPNALSCVLRVSGSAGSALLTGDIEQEQEAALVAEQGASLRSSVLIVAHHGSRTSSTTPFLAAVSPATAVIQAGYRNRFGHPAAPVLERLSERGIRTLVSPGCGAWRWNSDARSSGSCERATTRRYWRHTAGGAPD